MRTESSESSPDQPPLRIANATLEMTDGTGVGFLVDLELAPTGDHIGCISLRIRAYASNTQEQEDHPELDLPLLGDADREINAGVVRHMKTRTLIQSGIKNQRLEAKWAEQQLDRTASTFDEWLDQLGFSEYKNPVDADAHSRRVVLEKQYAIETAFYRHEHEVQEWLNRLPAKAPIPMGRPRIADEVLREVAAIYTAACERGQNDPSQEVRRQMNLTVGQDRRWVMYARRRGFLPSTEPRKARGATAEKEEESS